MKRSSLETAYFKKRTTESLKRYRRQKNYCSKLYKKERKNYFNKLKPSVLSDNKNFWKNVQPIFSEKSKTMNKITMVENDLVSTNEKVVAEKLNNYFTNIADNLKITSNEYLIDKEIQSSDPILNTIQKFKFHPSIITLKKSKQNFKTFEFSATSKEDMKNEIVALNPGKSGTHLNIPTKILKLSLNTCCEYLTSTFNDMLENCSFPDRLKLADITPIFKKGDATIPDNYRPISVLPVVSKLFERIMQNQMYNFLNDILSPFICGYRKGFSAEQALLSIKEKWKKVLDEKGYGRAILMDLSKAFDTINPKLLLAKLDIYGFGKSALCLLNSYLNNRQQRTKVNQSFSKWSEIKSGVPQGSVLGPLLFNIYVNDLFYIINHTDVCNYADDTTFHACGSDINELMLRLEHDSLLAIEWFENNFMKLNEDKCHYLLSGYKHEMLCSQIGSSKIWESNEQKLLGVVIDRNLSFDTHISQIC